VVLEVRRRHGDKGVVTKEQRRVARVEWCGVVRRLPREEERRRLSRTDSATVTHGVAVACAARGAGVAAWSQQLAVDRQCNSERRQQLSE
jgi:hypothetical protein